MRKPALPPVTWTVVGASLLTTLGTLPVFLLSAQAVAIRRELDFGQVRFGIAVATFFAAASLAAVLLGSQVDRFGRRRSTVVAGSLCAVGGAGVTVLAHTWPVLLAAMALLGVANAVCAVTSNLSMATAVPAARRGLGFGVKQAAVPMAIVLAGLAVPTVSAALGWRATFLATAVAGLVAAGAGLRISPVERTGTGAEEALDRPPRAALLVTMVGIMLASAAANSLGSYIASWGFEVGLTPGQAGLLMAFGSALNVAARLLGGHLADRREGRNLPVVAVQMAVGAVALAVVAAPQPATVVPAAVLAFAVGWSWPGLLLYAVVRIGRDAPAAASGLVQAGAYAGGAAGPLLFGLVVATGGYSVAWGAAAVSMGLAAGLIVVARRLFIVDLEVRPPRRQIRYGGGRRAPARTTRPRE